MNDSLTMSIARIGPAEATQYLTAIHPHARPVSPKKVSSYARDMSAGSWSRLTDIRFDKMGRLKGGRHVLTAVVESGTSQPFLILRGLPE